MPPKRSRADALRVVAQRDQDVGRGLDERGRAADVAVRLEVRRPAVRVDRGDVDPLRRLRPAVRRLAGVDVADVQTRLVAYAPAPARRRNRRPPACAPNRSAGTAAGREPPPRARIIAISGTTPEPPATSSTGAVCVARQTNQPPTGPRSSSWSPDLERVGQVGRDLAVVEPLDGQLDPAAVGRPGRGDRVAALGAVAVLARSAGRRRAGPAGGPASRGRRAPACGPTDVSQRASATVATRQVSRPGTAARATGLRTCGSRRLPRSPVRPRSSTAGR